MEVPISVQALVIVLFVLGNTPAAAAEARSTPPDPESPIYTFDPRADELLALLYPRRVTPAFFTVAFAERGQHPSFRDLDEVYQHHLRSPRPASRPASEVDLGDDNIDSYWNLVDRDPAVAARFLEHCRQHRLRPLLEHFSGADLERASVLEKALFQRDVSLTWSLLFRATRQAEGELRRYGEELKAALRELVPKLALRPEEYRRLLATLPAAVDRELFAGRLGDRRRPYLPGRVLAPEAGWYEIPFRRRASRHFEHYGGRSFVRVWIKIPGMSEQGFADYWDRLFDIAGTNLTVTSRLPPVAAGTQTLLLRTLGVFLNDGRYADSKIPEAVLMRIMKFPRQRLDLDSADYRGTVIVSYSLQRRALFADPATLGLHRNGLDDPAFFGFFERAPDPFNSATAALTTVRNNCTNCHAELLYGASTIFSLSRRRPPDPGAAYRMGGMLEPTGEGGFYRLATAEGRALLAGLGGTARP